MNKQKNSGKLRWIFYIVISMVFGAIDYYFLDPIIRPNLIPALLVWLIPLIPIAIYEVRASGSKKTTIIASVTSWIAAVVAYYTCYAITLSLKESMVSFSMGDIVIDILLWSIIAVVGGGMIGFLVATVYKWIASKK